MSQAEFDVGDVTTQTIRVYNSSGALTDATVVATTTNPSGITATPSVTHGATGNYSVNFTLDLAGPWYLDWAISGAVTDVSHVQLYAADPRPAVYASLDELKHELRIATADTSDDSSLLDKLSSASRRIDKDTGRKHGFGLDKVASSRIYRPRHEELLSVDDIGSETSIVVEIGRVSTWSVINSSLWDAWPENAIVDGRAIETIRRLVGAWPLWGVQRVRITARWGWPYIPDDIKNATLLLAARLFRRKDSPEGIRGFSDLGVMRVSRYDADYDSLINGYIKDAP